jgi:hypothetical protein
VFDKVDNGLTLAYRKDMRWLTDNWGWLLFGLIPLLYFVGQGVVQTIRRRSGESGTSYWT